MKNNHLKNYSFMERFNAFNYRFKKVHITLVEFAIDVFIKGNFLDLDLIVAKV